MKYFQIKKEEVYDIINSHDIDERLISVRESGMEIFIGEGMWIRYGLGLKDNLPLGLIIRNPNVNIGYKNARAGMLLRDLEKEFPAVEDKSNEIKDVKPNLIYEKYFQLRQGELTRIKGYIICRSVGVLII